MIDVESDKQFEDLRREEVQALPVRKALLYVFRHGDIAGPYKDDPGITENGREHLMMSLATSDLPEQLKETQDVGAEINLFITHTRRSNESMDALLHSLRGAMEIDEVSNVQFGERIVFPGLYPENTIGRVLMYEDPSVDPNFAWLQYTKKEAVRLGIRSYIDVARAFSALPLIRYFASEPYPPNPMKPMPEWRVPSKHQITIAVSHAPVLASMHKFYSRGYTYDKTDIAEGACLRFEMDYDRKLIHASNSRRSFDISVDHMKHMWKQYSFELDEAKKTHGKNT